MELATVSKLPAKRFAALSSTETLALKLEGKVCLFTAPCAKPSHLRVNAGSSSSFSVKGTVSL